MSVCLCEQRATGRPPVHEEISARGFLGSSKNVGEVLHAAGDAQSQLIICNVRLVHKIAQQYRSPQVIDYEDLFQVHLAFKQSSVWPLPHRARLFLKQHLEVVEQPAVCMEGWKC